MGNQLQYPYQPEEQRWHSQPLASYPNMGSYEVPSQPQAGYQNQGPASPYPQQPGHAGNNPYAVPPASPIMYQPPVILYTQAPYERVDPYKNKAIAGLILGVVAVSIWGIASFLGAIPALICGIIGIILSSQGRRSPTQRTQATIGLVLSIIGLILAILVSFIVLIFVLAPASL